MSLYINMRLAAILIFLAAMPSMLGGMAHAQQRTVQNRPYTDLRPFHFGVVVGTHLQDMELTNVGQQTYIGEDGKSTRHLSPSTKAVGIPASMSEFSAKHALRNIFRCAWHR